MRPETCHGTKTQDAEYHRQWYNSHPEFAERQSKLKREKYSSHSESEIERVKRWHQETKFLAETVLATYWHRSRECMFDLTPNATVFGKRLSEFPCSGPLEIDHINGGGRSELSRIGSRGLRKNIVNGKRTLSDLRLLCFVHNRLYRSDATGGMAYET